MYPNMSTQTPPQFTVNVMMLLIQASRLTAPIENVKFRDNAMLYDVLKLVIYIKRVVANAPIENTSIYHVHSEYFVSWHMGDEDWMWSACIAL